MHHQFVYFALVMLLACGNPCAADERPANPVPVVREQAPEAPQRWVVVVVGLTGNDEFAVEFDTHLAGWKKGLKDALGIGPDRTLILRGPSAGDDVSSLPATRDSLAKTLESLAKRLGTNDAIWVFTLGHGSYDDERAFFHLPGPDLDDAWLERAMEPFVCREQVLWLTHSGSGWFLKRLSRPGRVVMTATSADFEFNSTEFPGGLASVLTQPPVASDEDRDGGLSVLELFRAAEKATLARFAADKRVPTETALLDDNGDGKGTQAEMGWGAKALATSGADDDQTIRLAASVTLSADAKSPEPASPAPGPSGPHEPDGRLASSIRLSYRQDSSPSPAEAPESPK